MPCQEAVGLKFGGCDKLNQTLLREPTFEDTEVFLFSVSRSDVAATGREVCQQWAVLGAGEEKRGMSCVPVIYNYLVD